VATGKAKAVRELAVSEIGMKSPLGLMACDDRYKWWADDGKEYLFDLEADPFEMNNLAAADGHRETLSLMRGRALTFLRSTQVNLAEGGKSKVQRLREAAGKAGAKPE